MNKNYIHSDITEKIIKEAYYVYNILGYGFLEKVYEKAMFKRLNDLNINIKKQEPINVYFEQELVGEYFADLIVENKVIVELKAASALNNKHEVQLVNYLRATEIEVGLLINFGEKLKIIRRVFSNEQGKKTQIVYDKL